MSSKKTYIWRIYIAGAKAQKLGYVEAADEKAAMEKAAEEFQLTPEQAKRLIAQRADLAHLSS